MAYNTNNERLLVKGSERITHDLQVNGDTYLSGNIYANVIVENNAQIVDLNVTNLTADNVDINNCVANNFNVSELVASNASFNNIIANGATGNNGQVLGKVNGNVEWMDVASPINTDNFFVNNITINNSATLNGYDVTSMTIINESDYYNLRDDVRSQAFYLTSPNGNMYIRGLCFTPQQIITSYIAFVDLPNFAQNNSRPQFPTLKTSINSVTGNTFVNGGRYNGIMYKSGVSEGWDNQASVNTDIYNFNIETSANKLYIKNAYKAFYNCRSLQNLYLSEPNIFQYATNMSSAFWCDALLNQDIKLGNNITDLSYTFYNCFNLHNVFSPNDTYNLTNMNNTFYRCYNFNQPINITDSVVDMAKTFSSCDKFNQPITIGNNVTNMTSTFSSCYNFNQPITIPDSVTNISRIFQYGYAFNQPVTIGNGVIDMTMAFDSCNLLNQPINIPNSVVNMFSSFSSCTNFNQPINIPNSVTNMYGAFRFCNSLNQPITIGENVTNMNSAFYDCRALKNSTVPIHISHTIALGDTSNYIYNMLVNNGIGILIDPSRILNDA